MSEVIFYLFYPLILMLMLLIPMLNLKLIKLSKKSLLLFSLISYLIILLLFLCKLDTISLFLFISSSLIYLYISSKNLLYSVITVLFSISIIIISDTLTGLICSTILNIQYKTVSSNIKLYSIVGVVILIVDIIISRILSKQILKLNFKYIKIHQHKQLKYLLATVVITLALLLEYLGIYKHLYIYFSNFDILLHELLMLTFFMMILIFMYSFTKIIANVLKQDYLNKEYSQLQNYTNMLENLYTDLRRFKHDYLNILSTLGDFIEDEDINGLREYYNKEILPESYKIMSKDKHLALLKYIKVIPLKALVSSKLIYAQSKGVETKIELIENIEKINIRTIDICRIIGILLDNAIEASLLCEKKVVHFAIVKNNNMTIFIINNTCINNIPPIYKLYEDNYSTKGKNHGIGLKTIRNIINNDYNNILLNTKFEDGLFKQELIIKENDN